MLHEGAGGGGGEGGVQRREGKKEKEKDSQLRALNERRLWGDPNKMHPEVMRVDENASRTLKKKKRSP